MKKWLFLIVLTCLAGEVFANPIIVYDPTRVIPYAIVVGSCLLVEACIAAFILFFFDLSPKPVAAVLFIGNLVIYFVLFRPLYERVDSFFVSEAMIVVLDGILIKIICSNAAFQENTFKRLRWPAAFMVAAIGNVVSYYVGVAIGW